MKSILTGTIEKISTRVDGSININFGTQEIGDDEAGRLFRYRGKYCKILISDDNITPLEENLVSAEPIAQAEKNKSGSQRLRAVLFRVHEQTKPPVDFDQFYKSEIEQIITHYKSKLN